MHPQFHLTPRRSVLMLIRLRWLALTGQSLTILTVPAWMQIPLPWPPLLITLLLLATWNLLSLVWLRGAAQVGPRHVFSQLAVDVVALTCLLFWTGGAGNPFVMLYLVPVTLAVVSLPPRHAWALVTLSAALSLFILINHVPLEGHDLLHRGAPSLHDLAMWIGVMLSAGLVAVFGAALAQAVRERDRQLAEAREDTLRDEQIVALGTLAAGAAHQLATPLSTMAVLVQEMREQWRTERSLDEQLGVLQDQLRTCEHTLEALRQAADQTAGEQGARRRVRAYVEELLAQWRLIRPGMELRVHWQQGFRDVCFDPDPRLAHALLNLLNNAADASWQRGCNEIAVELACDGTRLEVVMVDFGPGVEADLRQLARLAYSTKPTGMGLGLALSHASLSRLGGEVSLETGPHGGGLTRLSVPLQGRVEDDRHD